jgi:predicted membrane-bound spermidine synthase
MLATFLFGLSLGSGIGSRLASTRDRAISWFAVAQIGVSGLSLAAFAMIDRLPELVSSNGPGPGELSAADVLLCGSTLLPGAIAIGATFPLAVRVQARGADEAASATARVFAWNTIGTIAGALAAGYLALPMLRFAGAAAAAAGLSLALAAATALLAKPRRKGLAAAALAGLIMLGILRPGTPWRTLRHSPMTNSDLLGGVVFYGVGRSSTVLLSQMPAGWRLTTNGLPESSISAEWGRPGRYVAARWLSLLALACRPETRSMLVIGLGAGVTVEDIPSSVEEIHVVELEPEVVRANRFMARLRRTDPLADQRLRLHLGDARSALRLTGRTFDAIVSQPSHPWTSGASHLFTRELFTQAHDHLTPDGVFVQWMGLPFVDDQLLRSLVATAVDVFPQVELYQPLGNALLLVASKQPLELETTVERGLALDPREWRRVGVRNPQDVLSTRVLSAKGARMLAATAADGPSTDSRNLFRMRSPRVLSHPLSTSAADRLFAAFEPARGDLEADRALGQIRRLIRLGSLDHARRVAEAQRDPVVRRTGVGWVELAAGRRRPAERALRQALRLDPGSVEALSALLLAYRPAIERGEPFPIAARARQDPAAALVAGWRLNAAGDWTGVQRLERRLEEVDSHHPLWAAATRLRVSWRIGAGQGARALELLEPLLAPVARPDDLLLRARAAASIGSFRTALAALDEALAPGHRRRAPWLAAEARTILRSIPDDPECDGWRQRLQARVE